MSHCRRAFLALLPLFLLAACAFSGQTVMLDPQLTNGAFNLGRDRPVHLTVVDSRPSPLIGYRKNETGDQARIETGGDVVGIVRDVAETALEDKGFAVASSPSGAVAQLTVEIVDIGYQASGAYFAPSATTRAVFKGIAQRGGTTFEQTYRIEKQSREALPLTPERNAELINETVSEALTMLADDLELMGFLAGRPAPAI